MKTALPFSRPRFDTSTITDMVAVLESGWLTTGPRVAAFEAALASHFCVDRALALNSCTAALHLALKMAGVGFGDEVIVPALTYCASAHPIIHCGAKPVVVDVSPQNSIIDLDACVENFNEKTKAIIVVHFGGYPASINKLIELANQRGISVIEDCAHAIEATVDGRAVGSLGDFGCFSFYATKNVTTGEGGH